MKKIMFVFKGGRTERLNDLNSKKIPSDFFYGFPQLKAKGYNVKLYEKKSYVLKNGLIIKYLKYHSSFLRRILNFGIDTPTYFNELDILNKNDIIIAIPDSIAIALAYYIKRKWLRPELIYCAMGLASSLEKIKSRNLLLYKIINCYFKKIISACSSIIVLGKGEYEFFASEFPEIQNRLFFLPFGVDIDFWYPDQNRKLINSTVLFIGNDLNRDFKLVIDIAKKMPAFNFIFVTSRINENELPVNVKLIKGDWRNAFVSDLEIRDLYYKSKIVILPLKESLQPSGQSVSLQAMACGRPVIITKTKGFWEPDKYEDRKHCIFVKTRNVEEWERKISDLIKDKKLYEKIAFEGRKLIEQDYTSNKFSLKIEEVIKKL